MLKTSALLHSRETNPITAKQRKSRKGKGILFFLERGFHVFAQLFDPYPTGFHVTLLFLLLEGGHAEAGFLMRQGGIIKGGIFVQRGGIEGGGNIF